MNCTRIVIALLISTINFMLLYQTISRKPHVQTMEFQSNMKTRRTNPPKTVSCFNGINVPETINDSFVENTFSRWRTRDPNDHMLTIEPLGRLGNLMFQYASLLGIALRNGKRPFIKPDNVLNTVFNLSFVESWDTKQWLQIAERQFASYSPEFEHLPAGNYVMGHYFQSWKYFQPIRKQIRKEFRFSGLYERLRRNIFHLYTSPYKNRTVIALHVRRTDMMTPNNAGYTDASVSYIYKAVQHMRDRFRNPVFLIATDDKAWCRQNLDSEDMILMTTTNPFVDFGALILSDHMIMTVGTFGWWAAWLINGYTVYYKDYPTPGGMLEAKFTKEDYFMPHWIPMGG
ncbi:galactoside alpha-(1,2)-fucosyltransferase 1-like [Haliotis cracherodii]|uniref:galactoside alpha-(1,2)-fucosyltransferase 1-like n=1 Tax=Haliotis cracherodii TaxID=6455 RepID=UPI0039E84991